MQNKLPSVLRGVKQTAISALLLWALWESSRWVFFWSGAVFSDYLFPSSLQIVSKIPAVVLESFKPLVLTSLTVVAVIIFSIVVAFMAGIFFKKNRGAYRNVRDGWDILRSIPPSILFPFFVLIFGFHAFSKFAVPAYFASLYLSLLVADSLMKRPQAVELHWERIGLSKLRALRYLTLPIVLFSIASGIRLTASLTVALVIICEMFLGAPQGVGGKILNYSESQNLDKMLALALVTGFLGALFNRVIDAIAGAAESAT